MRLCVVICSLVMLVATGCSKSKAIDAKELVGTWEAQRWGKGALSGAIVFRADGSLTTAALPWAAVTGDIAHLADLESVAGKWKIKNEAGKQVVWLEFEQAKSTGQGYMMAIEPVMKGNLWTFTQYIGDPDLMDVLEFTKR